MAGPSSIAASINGFLRTARDARANIDKVSRELSSHRTVLMSPPIR
jgi:hypothetical protein